MRLKTTTETLEGVPCSLICTGEIDLPLMEVFEDALAPLLSSASPVVTIDLTGVQFIDSSGLRVLANAVRALSPQKRSLRVLAVAHEGNQCAKVLRIGGFNKIMTIDYV